MKFIEAAAPSQASVRVSTFHSFIFLSEFPISLSNFLTLTPCVKSNFTLPTSRLVDSFGRILPRLSSHPFSIAENAAVLRCVWRRVGGGHEHADGQAVSARDGAQIPSLPWWCPADRRYGAALSGFISTLMAIRIELLRLNLWLLFKACIFNLDLQSLLPHFLSLPHFAICLQTKMAILLERQSKSKTDAR